MSKHMTRRLGKIKSCKNLAKFHARFWQDNVRQEIAKTSYINLAKFLARFWQGSPDKKLPRCVTRFLLSFFITLESTALSLSCLTLKSDLYF